MKNRIQSYIKFIIYMIAIVLINVAGITLFFRMDLTDNRIYSISKASQRVVSTLSEPLTIKVFFSKDLPAPHNNTERYLHDLLEEYSIHGNSYFNYRFYDVSLDEGGVDSKTDKNLQAATNYGIYPVQIQNIEKDEVKFQKAYMGLVIIHGDMIEKIPTLTSTDGLEYKLTTSIQKLNNKISALLNLKENIKIKLFLSSSLKIIAPYIQLNELPSIPDKLEEIVEKLNAKTFGKLSFERFDPSTDKDLDSVIKEYNILSLNWPAIAENNIEPGGGSVGLVMEYQDKAITIPIVNVYGVIHHSRYLPDRRDLNRVFPGSESGSLASRLAHLFMSEIVANCTHGIDIHTGALHRSNLPQIRVNLADPDTERLARAFGVPVIINADLRDGSLREAASEQGIPMLLYEAGEALRFACWANWARPWREHE